MVSFYLVRAPDWTPASSGPLLGLLGEPFTGLSRSAPHAPWALINPAFTSLNRRLQGLRSHVTPTWSQDMSGVESRPPHLLSPGFEPPCRHGGESTLRGARRPGFKSQPRHVLLGQLRATVNGTPREAVRKGRVLDAGAACPGCAQHTARARLSRTRAPRQEGWL